MLLHKLKTTFNNVKRNQVALESAKIILDYSNLLWIIILCTMSCVISIANGNNYMSYDVVEGK